MKQTTDITDMAMLLKEFFETYLPKERGVSRHTVRSYSNTFQSLYMFFRDNKGIRANKLSINDLSRQSIKDYLNWLEAEKAIKYRHAILGSHQSKHSVIMHNIRMSKIWQDGRRFYQSDSKKQICLIYPFSLRKG